MIKKSLVLAAATLGLAVSFTAAPTFAQSTNTIYLHSADTINAAKRALRHGDAERATALFEKGLKQKLPRRLRVAGLNNLCIAYRLQGDLEAAKESCSQAIELNPNYWRAYNNRANAYYDQQNYLAALTDYEAALEINPKSSLVRQNIGAVKTLVSLAE
jgi:tetratricopeptide (TPR) repeat protein